MSTNPSKILIGGTLIAAAGVAIGFWIGDRHRAESVASAVTQAEKSASEAARPHHPDFPAKSSPQTTRDLHTLGIKIDPQDIGGSLGSFSALTRPEEKIAAVRELMSQMPEYRWLEMLWVPWARQDTAITETVFEYIAMKGPEGCLGTLLEKGDREKVGRLLQAWAGHDLPAALAFFEAHPEKMAKAGSSPFVALTREYSLTNPDAALTWIGTLPDAVKDDAAATWLGVAARKDAWAAVHLYESGPDYLRGEYQAQVICNAWAGSDPEAALAWAARLTVWGGQYAEAAVIKAWAGRDFDAAFKAVSTLPADAQAPVLKGLTEAAKTPERLAQMGRLIGAIPEGAERLPAAGLLGDQWSNSDPDAAGAWVDGLPPGPTRDFAMDRFGWPRKDEDLPTYFDRQATMQNPEARQRDLQNHIVSWLGRDPEAARTWVKDSPKLTPEDREALLKITGR